MDETDFGTSNDFDDPIEIPEEDDDDVYIDTNNYDEAPTVSDVEDYIDIGSSEADVMELE